MRIRWTLAAAADLEHIKGYLDEHLPHLAQSTILELYETIRSLKTLPLRGHPGREEGTRELVFARLPYIAVYRVKNETVEVLHIYHGAQQRR
ncbi:MAG TPA: type II toxin-antitoxin system RelE/ParE family toxin [Candidatus Acidoferrales bacterium]|nr:type II toxin-antitoxin system RelE/ParE family toxin [Candidatus Acidoferrales bacterium]